jgi:hypothetical protein
MKVQTPELGGVNYDGKIRMNSKGASSGPAIASVNI